jgi:hypothetical protein
VDVDVDVDVNVDVDVDVDVNVDVPARALRDPAMGRRVSFTTTSTSDVPSLRALPRLVTVAEGLALAVVERPRRRLAMGHIVASLPRAFQSSWWTVPPPCGGPEAGDGDGAAAFRIDTR